MALYGIRLEEVGAKASVGLWGEFDLWSLAELRAALDRVSALGGPVAVDLSGVVFMDLQSARELVVRSLIQAHQLTFENPSPGVLASIRALGMGRAAIGPDREEPQVFSGAG